MPSLLDRVANTWEALSRSDSKVIRGHVIPPAQVRPKEDERPRFKAGEHYFSVVINEMFLANGREWFNLYDPMALVVTEFTYGGKQIAVPYVVGPSMLEGKVKSVPNGMAITDTKVAGLSPYAGGKFALTIVLAKVKRKSYAKDLLRVVENVANAFPIGAAIAPQLKIAETVLDGVQSLFGMAADVSPLIGHRWEYNPGNSPWFNPGFFALINSDEADLAINRLGVVNGRLLQGVNENASGFRDTDFVLYNVARHDERDDLSELPFHALYKAALVQAASIEDGAWERAKAGLATVYQEMLSSSDLTWGQTQSIVVEFKNKLVQAQGVAKNFKVMSGRAAAVGRDLSNPPGMNEQPDSERRAVSLGGANDLLKLEAPTVSDTLR